MWFDAVIDYFSASIGWAGHSGDPEAWRKWQSDPRALSYYFMGEDNTVSHSQIRPAGIPGYNGQGVQGGKPGEFGVLNPSTEVVSSEFLIMEGRKFSSSHGIVIYVRDVLTRYQTDALRYSIPAAGPETSNADLTWTEFLRHTNGELAAGRSNLVNRTALMIAKKFGEVPAPDPLQGIDRVFLDEVGAGFDTIDDLVRRHYQEAVFAKAVCLVGEASKCVTETASFRLKTPGERERPATVLHTLTQAITGLNFVLSSSLSHATNDIDTVMGGQGKIVPMPRIGETEELNPEVLSAALEGRSDYPITTDDHVCALTWERHEIEVGTPITKSTLVFVKLDKSIVEEELARYADPVPDDMTGV